MPNNIATKLPAVQPSNLAQTVTQASHGFTIGAPTPVYYGTGGSWAKADSSNGNGLAIGIAVASDANTFTLYTSGAMSWSTTLTATTGNYYYVSDVTPGTLTATEPTSNLSYSNPILFATASNSGIVMPYRPSAVQGGIWPGSTGQLTSAAGTAVTVGTGLTLNSGTLSSSISSRTTLDANHIYGWWLDDASGSSTFAAAAGAITPPTTGAILGDTGMWRNYKCALCSGDATGVSISSLSINTSQNLTFEMFVQIEPSTFRYPGGNRDTLFFDDGAAQNGLFFFGSSSSPTLRVSSASGSSDTSVPVGSSFPLSQPTHVMASWTGASTGTINWYINGEIVNTLTRPQRTANITRLVFGLQGFGQRWGGLLISNNIRDINYARAQTQLMRKW